MWGPCLILITTNGTANFTCRAQGRIHVQWHVNEARRDCTSQGQGRVAELLHSRPFKHANSRKCGYSSQKPKHCQPALSLSRNRGRGSSTTYIKVHKVQFNQPVKLQKAAMGWIAARAYFLLLKLQAWQSHRQLQIWSSSGFSCGLGFFACLFFFKWWKKG